LSWGGEMYFGDKRVMANADQYKLKIKSHK